MGGDFTPAPWSLWLGLVGSRYRNKRKNKTAKQKREPNQV